MKQTVIEAIDNLKGFLDNIDSINKHPYSKGVDVDKLIIDLKNYANDLKGMVDKIEEVSTETVKPDVQENE